MTPQQKQVIETLSPAIINLVKSWKLNDEDGQISNVKKWLLNFTSDEIPYIFKILPLLQIKKSEDTDDALNQITQHLLNKFGHDLNGVYFFPLGDEPASSGGRFIYPLSRNISHQGANFNDIYRPEILRSPKAIVFIDDMVGSGNQAAKFFKKHLEVLTVPCYYYPLYGYKKGLDYLRQNSGFKLVFSPNIIQEKSKIFSEYTELEDKERCMKIALKYGRLLYPEHPLGYEDSQAMICFTDNCPNNTLPIIWAGYKNEMKEEMAWHPLFERKKMKKSLEVRDTGPVANKRFEKAIDLVDYFYKSVMSRHFEEAFYCFEEEFRVEKYGGKDNVKYFKDGYTNTDSIKGKPRTLLIHDEEAYARILVHYYETANVFKFKDLQEISTSNLSDLRRNYNQIKEFTNILKRLGANPERINNIPLYLFFSLNAVEDVTWSCGISHETASKEFKAHRRAIARVKYFDCVYIPEYGWNIRHITPVFPTGEPFN